MEKIIRLSTSVITEMFRQDNLVHFLVTNGLPEDVAITGASFNSEMQLIELTATSENWPDPDAEVVVIAVSHQS